MCPSIILHIFVSRFSSHQMFFASEFLSNYGRWRPSRSWSTSGDLTIIANIRSLIPTIPESEHLYDEYEHLSILHLDSRQPVNENSVDAIQDYIWTTCGLVVRKRDFFLNLRVPFGRANKIARWWIPANFLWIALCYESKPNFQASMYSSHFPSDLSLPLQPYKFRKRKALHCLCFLGHSKFLHQVLRLVLD